MRGVAGRAHDDLWYGCILGATVSILDAGRFGSDEFYPSYARWYTRLQQCPAYREHVMVPFEDLKAKLEY